MKVVVPIFCYLVFGHLVLASVSADTRTNQRAMMRNIPDPTRSGPRIDKNTSAFLKKGNQSSSAAAPAEGPVPLPESDEIRPSPESIKKNAHRTLDTTVSSLPAEKIHRNDLQPSSVD